MPGDYTNYVRGAILAMVGICAATTSCVVAAPVTSITLDGSLGHAPGAVNPLSPGFYQITPAMGKTVDSNLFQSFGTFNLGTGDTADFTADAGTQNIIARVTGGASSMIDGTIESEANLYFINPAGIMFTANASLNVNGAFVASTANYVKLSDGTMFYADVIHPINDAGLTSAPISAFGFTFPTPAPISFVGTFFENAGGVHVIGGDLTLDQGAVLYAPSGNLTLFSAGSAGEVPFSLASPGAGFSATTTTAYGNITMTNNARVAIDGSGGGSIVIRGGKLTVDNSSITSTTTTSAAGGNISVQAAQVVVQDAGVISSSNYSSGTGGSVSVNAGTLSVDSSQASGSAIFVYTDGPGHGGDINITVDGLLSITDTGQITANNVSSGQAGDITVTAGTLSVNGSSAPTSLTGLTNQASSTGDGGKMTVTVSGAATLSDGGEITTLAESSGDSGNLFVSAQSLTVDGGNIPKSFTGIASQAQDQASETIGSLTVEATSLTLKNGGQISGSTFTNAQGGDVMVSATNLAIIGTAAGYPSYISAETRGMGDAGDIVVTVSDLFSIQGEGGIDSSTFARGQAGDVRVHAGSLSIDGLISPENESAESGISSSSLGQATGGGGSVIVKVDHDLSISHGGVISAVTFTSGNAGTVSVTADTIDIRGFENSSLGPAGSYPTGIFGDTFNTGDAGSVTVNAGSLSIDSGGGDITGISSSSATNNFSIRHTGAAGSVVVKVGGAIRITGTGGGIAVIAGPTGTNAGDVTVQAGSVDLQDVDGVITIPLEGSLQGGITAQTLGSGSGGSVKVTTGILTMDSGDIIASSNNDGGDITLVVSKVVNLRDSQIKATASTGTGGNIKIDPPLVLLNDSEITASAQIGQGGDISILASNFLEGNSIITASGTRDGTVTISSPTVDLSGSLLPLPAVLASDANRLRESCARSINHEFSSLVVVGRGGTESSPDELQPDFGMGETFAIPSPAASSVR